LCEVTFDLDAEGVRLARRSDSVSNEAEPVLAGVTGGWTLHRRRRTAGGDDEIQRESA